MSHEVSRCDICHKEMKGFGTRGYIHGINMITRYCEKCWSDTE